MSDCSVLSPPQTIPLYVEVQAGPFVVRLLPTDFFVGDRPLWLTPLEEKLLAALMLAPEQRCTREEVIQRLRQSTNTAGAKAPVISSIPSSLNQALSSAKSDITAVGGNGTYRITSSTHDLTPKATMPIDPTLDKYLGVVITFGPLTAKYAVHSIQHETVDFRLSNMCTRLLAVLLSKAGTLLNVEEVTRRVWRLDHTDVKTLNTHMYRLKQALGHLPGVRLQGGRMCGIFFDT